MLTGPYEEPSLVCFTRTAHTWRYPVCWQLRLPRDRGTLGTFQSIYHSRGKEIVSKSLTALTTVLVTGHQGAIVGMDFISSGFPCHSPQCKNHAYPLVGTSIWKKTQSRAGHTLTLWLGPATPL